MLSAVLVVLLITYCPRTSALQCINSTSYMDRVLAAPASLNCTSKSALCVKTMQISSTDGLTNVLSVHRECYEQLPIDVENGCVDSYDDTFPSRRTGPHIITCYCSSNLCNF